VAKFTGEKNGEASGVFADGSPWHIKFDANGAVDVKDDQIAAALLAASEHPDSPVKAKS
jgi:hypothetical protein